VLGDSVPEVESAVGACGAEGTVLWMERDSVDGVDIGDVVLRWVAMAFEGEVGACVLLLNILNSTSSLNTTHSETSSVCEAANYSRLPLQRALQCLVEFGRLAEVDHVDISIRSTNDKEVLLHVKSVDSLLALDCSNSLSLSQIPVFDSLVP